MTIWTPTDDGFADLTSHDTFVHGTPHNTYARLRRDDPIHWTEYKDGKGFWSITRHADIAKMNANTKVFSSAQGIRMEDQTYEEYLARRTFQETDGMEHRKVRMKVARAFSGPVIKAFEDDIRDLCNEILDDALSTDGFDATTKIARELPMRMLGRILGLPADDMAWLVEKGDALISNTDPEYTDHVLDKMTTDEFRMMPFNSPAGAELYAYAKDMMADKAAAGDTDVILHMIMQPDEEGNTITPEEFNNFFCLLVAAGNDTTRYSIAAGIHALTQQAGLLEEIKSGTVDDTMADEIIRWASPTFYFRRTATQDYGIHDKLIQEGDKVLYWFNSANRDDAMFDNPFVVDLSRKPNRNLAFGQGGPHVCLGIFLAKLEVRVLFQELAKRIRKIDLAGTPKYLRSNFVGGLKHLPVSIKRV